MHSLIFMSWPFNWFIQNESVWISVSELFLSYSLNHGSKVIFITSSSKLIEQYLFDVYINMKCNFCATSIIIQTKKILKAFAIAVVWSSKWLCVWKVNPVIYNAQMNSNIQWVALPAISTQYNVPPSSFNTACNV